MDTEEGSDAVTRMQALGRAWVRVLACPFQVGRLWGQPSAREEWARVNATPCPIPGWTLLQVTPGSEPHLHTTTSTPFMKTFYPSGLTLLFRE